MKHTAAILCFSVAALFAWHPSERASGVRGGPPSAATSVALPARALTPSVRAGGGPPLTGSAGSGVAPAAAANEASTPAATQSAPARADEIAALKADYLRDRDRVRFLTERRAARLLLGDRAAAETDYREILELTARRQARVERLRELGLRRARPEPSAPLARSSAAASGAPTSTAAAQPHESDHHRQSTINL